MMFFMTVDETLNVAPCAYANCGEVTMYKMYLREHPSSGGASRTFLCSIHLTALMKSYVADPDKALAYCFMRRLREFPRLQPIDEWISISIRERHAFLNYFRHAGGVKKKGAYRFDLVLYEEWVKAGEDAS